MSNHLHSEMYPLRLAAWGALLMGGGCSWVLGLPWHAPGEKPKVGVGALDGAGCLTAPDGATMKPNGSSLRLNPA